MVQHSEVLDPYIKQQRPFDVEGWSHLAALQLVVPELLKAASPQHPDVRYHAGQLLLPLGQRGVKTTADQARSAHSSSSPVCHIPVSADALISRLMLLHIQ